MSKDREPLFGDLYTCSDYAEGQGPIHCRMMVVCTFGGVYDVYCRTGNGPNYDRRIVSHKAESELGERWHPSEEEAEAFRTEAGEFLQRQRDGTMDQAPSHRRARRPVAFEPEVSFFKAGQISFPLSTVSFVRCYRHTAGDLAVELTQNMSVDGQSAVIALDGEDAKAFLEAWRSYTRGQCDHLADAERSASEQGQNFAFGSYIRHMREKAGLTLGDVAKSLNTKVWFLSDIERGRRPVPSRKFTHDLANILRIDLKTLNDLARGAVLIPTVVDGKETKVVLQGDDAAAFVKHQVESDTQNGGD